MWKPIMDVAEAEAWSAGTLLPGPWYHGSDVRRGLEMLRSGFDPYGGGIKRYGPGLYLTRSAGEARQFGNNPIEVRVNVRSIKTLPPRDPDDLPDIPPGDYDALVIPPKWCVVRRRECVTAVAVHGAHPMSPRDIPGVASKMASSQDYWAQQPDEALYDEWNFRYAGVERANDRDNMWGKRWPVYTGMGDSYKAHQGLMYYDHFHELMYVEAEMRKRGLEVPERRMLVDVEGKTAARYPRVLSFEIVA